MDQFRPLVAGNACRFLEVYFVISPEHTYEVSVAVPAQYYGLVYVCYVFAQFFRYCICREVLFIYLIGNQFVCDAGLVQKTGRIGLF